MKKIIIFYFLFFIFYITIICSITAQKKNYNKKTIALYEVIYAINAETDNKGIDSGHESLKLIVAETDKILKNAQSILLCNRTHSINYIEADIISTGYAGVIAKSILRADDTYYINLISKIVKKKQVKRDEISSFIVDNKIQWKITEDTAMVNGIKCIKALGTISTLGFNDTKITAWYTPDYPISMGPHGLYGLPGLILKYREGGTILTAYSIKNIESKKKEIENPSSENLKPYSETLLKSKSMLPKK